MRDNHGRGSAPDIPAARAVLSRRAFLADASAALAGAWLGASPLAGILRRATSPGSRPRPTAAQLLWQRDERAMFVHFGMNTFTNREWGDGTESPALFDPKALDARQWARAARAAGFRAMILTAKHHDGFCLWPTATTRHSVASSPWRGGKGDVVRAFTDACRAEGLRAGLYLSPWDRNAPSYGSPRYNDVYCAQLTELLSHYGPIAEVWFDGANGEGPNGRKQVYDWPRFFGLVRRLQPHAVIFSDAGPDVRWCGDEKGVAGDPDWSTVDPAAVPFPGASGPGVTAMLQHGDPAGPVWRPAECDVSIRPGWFYHPAQNDRVRSVDDLVDLYLSSVGRNGKLLLNVPPTRQGLLHPTDVARIRAMRRRLEALFADDVARHATPAWHRTGPRTATAEIDLGRPTTLAGLRLEEHIAHGQAVARFRVEAQGDGTGGWRMLLRGTTIGYARIHRLPPTRVRRVRLVIEHAVAPPGPVRMRLFGRA